MAIIRLRLQLQAQTHKWFRPCTHRHPYMLCASAKFSLSPPHLTFCSIIIIIIIIFHFVVLFRIACWQNARIIIIITATTTIEIEHKREKQKGDGMKNKTEKIHAILAAAKWNSKSKRNRGGKKKRNGIEVARASTRACCWTIARASHTHTHQVKNGTKLVHNKFCFRRVGAR